jgi:hypothetical protein
MLKSPLSRGGILPPVITASCRPQFNDILPPVIAVIPPPVIAAKKIIYNKSARRIK